MDAAGESGGIPRVSTRFSLSVENEQADAGRDSRTRLARPNSRARTGTGKKTFSSCSADHEQSRIGNKYLRRELLQTAPKICLWPAVRVTGAAFLGITTGQFCAPLFSHTHYLVQWTRAIYTIYRILYSIYYMPYTVYHIPYIYHTPYLPYTVLYTIYDTLNFFIFASCIVCNNSQGVVQPVEQQQQ